MSLKCLKAVHYYELEQKQRALERQVRATRRELAGYDAAMKAAKTDEERAAIKQEFDRASVKLKKQEARLKEHCKNNGLVYDKSRVQTYYGKNTTQGFGRSTSQKAVWANRKVLNNSVESGIIKKRISNGEYSTKISRQQYLKHIEGTKQYNDYLASRIAKGNTPQSRLTISEDEAQKIIHKYAGTGQPKTSRNGEILHIEFVECDNIVGEYFSNGEYHKTRRIAIHYSKKGAHIVPVSEKE